MWTILHIKPRKDGAVYEDEGDSYNYEHGVYSTIAFHWNDKTRTLTIGARQGQYPGMLTARQFTVILPNGTSKVIDYKGKEMPLAF